VSQGNDSRKIIRARGLPSGNTRGTVVENIGGGLRCAAGIGRNDIDTDSLCNRNRLSPDRK